LLFHRRLCCCGTAGWRPGSGATKRRIGARRHAALDPDLPGKIGFDNRSCADLVASGSASESAPGVRIERFMAPNGRQVTVSIAAPKIDGAYDVLLIRSGEDPARYIANAISHAGPHKTIVFPKSGIYNFSSAACQTGGAHLKLNAATDVVMLARKRSAWISGGVDDRPVRANRVRKSVGAENTFSSDLTEFDAMVAVLRPLIDKVWRHCEGTGNRGRTITLKVKFSDFEIITRSRSVPTAVSSHSDLERLSVGLLRNEMPLPKPVRLLGVSLSSLQAEVLAEPPTPPADLTPR
jgi:hypothetical protein